MPVIYGNQHVDERYSSIFEPNLFTNAWLVPGATFTNKYQEGPAGGYYVHKLKNVAAIHPTLPTGNVSGHKESADDLIQVVLNNDFKGSRKIPNVAAAAIAAKTADENLTTAIAEVREGREYSALACLITEGTESTEKTPLTVNNIKSMILKERASLVKSKGKANVILCSPDTYALLQDAAGKEFTPNRNERIQLNGQVNEWYGFTIIECNGLSTPEDVFYYDYKGEKVTVSAGTFAEIDFLMYYSEAFSVLDNLNAMRLIDNDPHFAGTYAQCFTNTGYRLTNSALARVRKHATT